MKKTKIVAGILAAFMAATFMVGGCGKSAEPTTKAPSQSRIDEIKKNGKLVLATGNYRPFEYHDEKTNKLVGYDIDLTEAIAKKIGVPLEVKEMQFTSLIPTLQNGQADIVIAAMYITDQRKEVVDFANPYMDTGMVLVVKGDNNEIKSLKDLDGKVIGVKTGRPAKRLHKS
ncbi:MAG: transporter substrate-binding domain-containing protein [Negativicutes bacterium]|nr:transporter substrate-binding domain-containing protein [Negativicutes bacterium]